MPRSDGRRLAEVRFGLARLHRFEDALTGAPLAGVETRGKALLIHCHRNPPPTHRRGRCIRSRR